MTNTPNSIKEDYLSGQYLDVIKNLLASKDKFPPAQFHYNLGTVHAKVEQFSVARFHLEKAKSLGFSPSKVEHNLRIVRQKLAVDDLSTSGELFDSFFEKANIIPIDGWISLVLFLLILWMCWVKWVLGKGRHFVAVVCFLFAFSPILFKVFYLNDLKNAIALEETFISEGPSELFPSKTPVKKGSKFLISEVKDGWGFIKFPIKQSGWVKIKDFGLY